MYNYEASNIRVIDGDTIECDIDLGFRLKIREKFRFLGVDTCELNSSDPKEREKAKAEKDFVVEAIKQAEKVLIKTHKTGKYGRWLAQIFLRYEDNDIDLNTMVKNKHIELGS